MATLKMKSARLRRVRPMILPRQLTSMWPRTRGRPNLSGSAQGMYRRSTIRPSCSTQPAGCVLCTMSQWVPTMITGELGARAFTQIQTDIQGASFARCHSECRRWLLESWAPEPSHRYRQTYRVHPLHDVTVSADDDYWRVGRPSLHTDTDRHTGCVLCTMSPRVPTMITGELGARAFTQIQTRHTRWPKKLAPFFVRLNFTKY